MGGRVSKDAWLTAFMRFESDLDSLSVFSTLSVLYYKTATTRRSESERRGEQGARPGLGKNWP
jgi:hypothetical protein